MYIFDSRSDFYRYPQGGIKAKDEIRFKIFIKGNRPIPEILVEKRQDYYKHLHSKTKMQWISREKNYDLYEAQLSIKEYGHYYYSFIFGEEKSENYELLIYHENYLTPSWAKGGIIYHIFVDRFYRRKVIPKEGALIRNWGETPHYLPDEKGEILNNDFFGGNLEGIKEKLPYIASLGVSIIYLSPIFEAYSNHKYDTGDYHKIDPMFGEEDTLKELCHQAKKYGIYIILDGVFSHTGSNSIYFNKNASYHSLGAYQSKDSPYYEWYTFNKWNDNYVSWWGIETLPEINENNPSYIEFITGENGVIQHWQKLGVMGWRLDVADELPDEFLHTLRTSIKKEKEDRLIIGEVWEDAANKYSYNKLKGYLLGEQLDSVTNYPLRNGIIQYVKNKDCTLLYNTMNKIMETYPPYTINCLMNILGTHDTERILTVLGSKFLPSSKSQMAESKLSEEELKKGIKLLKIASLLQFTLPGIPCIYYGDEVGLEGWKDPFNRRCYPWGNENKEILNHYKFLAHLRRNNIFREGEYKCLIHDRGIFVFERYKDTNRIVIAVNLSSEETTLKFEESIVDYMKNINSSEFIIDSNNFLILTNIENFTSHTQHKK
ncbi:MAG: glycoside hydrolase family 13 protein [Tissierellia bacterium]|nr:glycoside hydrolase family 13 protein [Tissierellia bacterium]